MTTIFSCDKVIMMDNSAQPELHPRKNFTLAITLLLSVFIFAAGVYVAVTARKQNPTDQPQVAVQTDPDADWQEFADPLSGITFRHPQMDSACCRISPPEGAPDARLVGVFAREGTVAPDRDQPFDGLAIYLIDTGLSLDRFIETEMAAEEKTASSGSPIIGKGTPVTAPIGPDTGISLNNVNRPHLTGYYVKTADGTVLAILKSQATPDFTPVFEKILASFTYSVVPKD